MHAALVSPTQKDYSYKCNETKDYILGTANGTNETKIRQYRSQTFETHVFIKYCNLHIKHFAILRIFGKKHFAILRIFSEKHFAISKKSSTFAANLIKITL
jgi:hypothetical protein